MFTQTYFLIILDYSSESW